MIGPDDPELAESVKKHEGVRYQVYDDDSGDPLERGEVLVGYATIGYGRNLHAGISATEAEHLLANDLASSYAEAVQFSWFESLSDARQRVIVEMIFNLGMSRFLGFQKLIAAITRSDFADAKLEMLDSKWRYQVGKRALTLADKMEAG